MQPAEIIESSLNYIEENLRADITADELAQLAGYSHWHFCRLFAQQTKMPVAGYITQRRLDRAFEEIAGGRRAIDAVMDYGFDTYAGFYKAFVRMYGCSPKRYLRLYGKYKPQGETSVMNTQKNLRVAQALEAQGFKQSPHGEPLPTADRFGADRAAYGFKYGQAIARLHIALAAVEDDIRPDEMNLLDNVIGWAMPEVKAQNIGLPDSFFDDYSAHFGKLFGALPKQLIHRDPNPGNILFSGGEVTGFVGFDLSERNVRLWDPCYCATGILSEAADLPDAQRKWPDILGGILRGYDSVTPLMPEEKQSVFGVVCSIQMVCIAWFEQREEYRHLAEISRDMLRFIADSRVAIERIFE